jgi:hypothetical protein
VAASHAEGCWSAQSGTSDILNRRVPRCDSGDELHWRRSTALALPGVAIRFAGATLVNRWSSDQDVSDPLTTQ